MASSKLFSGDLPELINEIIHHFHSDYKTLHSCTLVNRLWCRLAIPLLWENPFSDEILKNYHFIEIYLRNLNDDDKTKLNEYVIIHNDLSSLNTLFNYSKFIQCLNIYNVYYSINKWIVTMGTKEQHSKYFVRRTNLEHSQILNFTKLVYRLLFLIFIENEVNLRSLEITDLDHFDEVWELILQNPSFIYNIKSLMFDIYNVIDDDVIKFLGFFHSNCNLISSLDFPYISNYPTEKSLSKIVKSQKNLKKILLGYSEFPLLHLPLSLKNSNSSNTLNTIIFYYVDFKNITVLDEVLNYLNVLESIHIVYCVSLNSKFIQQVDNITKPFKLKSLIFSETLDIKTLELLIQKSGNYLENFGNESWSQIPVQLFESAMKYCNKIKLLSLMSGLNNRNINLVHCLIENIKLNLNYLFIVTYNVEISSVILQNLGQVLPFKLEYLYLHLYFNINDFEVFLKNSQNTFIKKLLIRNEMNEENEEIFPYIKEYIMKKKRVKYLAILGIFDKDLFFLKDKLEEFKLHDIQVLSCRDLFINIRNFIKDNY